MWPFFVYFNNSVLVLILWYMTRARIPTWRCGRIVQSPKILSNSCMKHPPPYPSYNCKKEATFAQKSESVQMSTQPFFSPSTHPDAIKCAAFCVSPLAQNVSGATPILGSHALIGPLSVCRFIRPFTATLPSRGVPPCLTLGTPT